MEKRAELSSANSAQELQDRLEFFGLDEKARAALRAIKPIVEREVERALDRFYDRARLNPNTRAFFSDEATIARAKGKQLQHWRRLANAEFEGETLETALRVGQTHARIGMPLKWYAAGYGAVLESLISETVVAMWPKGPLNFGRKGAEAGAALSALVRVALLDFELAASSYVDALAAKTAAAENTVREASREAQVAVQAVRGALGGLAAKNLGGRIPETLPSAYASMATDFNHAADSLSETMQNVSGAIGSLANATREIAQGAQDLSGRAEQEASSLEESTAALEEVAGQVSKTADGAQSAQSIVTQARAEAEESNKVVAQAISAMGRIEKSSNDIGQIIGVIDEIAFQTNLLALNAGVEAARAGDAGRGFAVVASEVRALAQRSAEAAKEIKALIAAASGEVAGGVELVTATGAALSRISAKVGQMSVVVGEISISARQQASSLEEIKQAVSALSGSTQQNAAMAEQSTAASSQLARETETLSQLIGQFDLGAAASAPPRRLAAPAAPAARAPAPRPRTLKVANGGEAADWREF